MTSTATGTTGTDPSARAYAEDVVVGAEYRLGQHEITERAIVEFATSWDPQFFHTDPAQRVHPRFTGVIASGIHSLAVLHRLSVDAVYSSWQVVAGRSLSEVTFLRPVLPGTILTGSARVESVVLDRPDLGLVRLACTLTSEGGVPLLTAVGETYLARRGAGDGSLTRQQ